MSFLSERSPSELVGAGILAIVLGLAGRAFMAGGIEEYFNPAKRAENQIVAALEERPADLAMLRALERYFPHEYDELLDRMADTATTGAPAELVANAGSAQLVHFLASHQSDFAFAPLPALDDFLARDTAAIEALAAQDPASCAGFADNPQDPLAKLDPASQALIGESVAARVRAISAGRADQQMRLEVTPGDLDALELAMREAGATEEQIALIFDGEGRAELSLDNQCDASLRMLRAIAGEEDGRRALLIGKLLAVQEPA